MPEWLLQFWWVLQTDAGSARYFVSGSSALCNSIKPRAKGTSNGCPVCPHHVWSLCLISHRRSQMFFQGMSVMFVVCWEGGFKGKQWRRLCLLHIRYQCLAWLVIGVKRESVKASVCHLLEALLIEFAHVHVWQHELGCVSSKVWFNVFKCHFLSWKLRFFTSK